MKLLREHRKWFFNERDDKNISCRVVGCREAKLTPSNPTGAKILSLDNHDVLHHLSSKHGITEVDYHRLKKPRLSIQRALTNLDNHRMKASTLETAQTVGSESSTGGVLLGQSGLALVRLITGCALPPNILSILDSEKLLRCRGEIGFYKLPSRRTFLRDNGPLHKMARHLAAVGSKKAAKALAISVAFDLWSKLSFTGIGITITTTFRRDRKL